MSALNNTWVKALLAVLVGGGATGGVANAAGGTFEVQVMGVVVGAVVAVWHLFQEKPTTSKAGN